MTAVVLDRRAQCLGKRGYEIYDEAKRNAKKRHAPFNIYRCPHCRHWHIGGVGPKDRTTNQGD